MGTFTASAWITTPSRFYSRRVAARDFPIHSDWETNTLTSGEHFWALLRSKGSGLPFTSTTGSVTTNIANVFCGQLVAEISEEVLISGTVKGQFGASESSSVIDLRAQIIIRVLQPNGSLRGTLLAADTGVLSSEWQLSSSANRRFPRGGAVALSSVTAQAGDFLVIEVGARKHAAGNSGQLATVNLADSGANGDLPEDETTSGTGVTTRNNWIEFSNYIPTIAKWAVKTSFTANAVLARATPGGTRFYLGQGVVTGFAFDAGWEAATTNKFELLTTKANEAATTLSLAETDASSTWDVALGQWVSPRLAAQTINGTVMGMVVVRETNAAANFRGQAIIRVIADDGTVRGTLYGPDAAAFTGEWSTAAVTRDLPRTPPAALSSVAAQAGDHLVIELGYRATNTSITSFTGELVARTDNADLSTIESQAATGSPWLEFSHTFAFLTTVLADAILWKTQAASVTADAVIESHTIPADAVILRTTSTTFTAAAFFLVVVTASFDADAIILSTPASSVTTDAVVRPLEYPIFADAVLFATQSASFTIDAIVTFAFTADALVFFERTEAAFTTDAFILTIVWADAFNRADEIPLEGYTFVSGPEEANLRNNVLEFPSYDDGFSQFAQFFEYRGWASYAGYGIAQFDFKTAADNEDVDANFEIDFAARLEADGNYWWSWIGAFVSIPLGLTQQTWGFYTANNEWEVDLDADTWYTVKFLNGGYDYPFDHLKVWPQGDPEPSAWQFTGDATWWSDTEPPYSAYQGFFNTHELEDLLFDNWVFASLEGHIYGFSSVSADAVIKRTWTFEHPSATAPTIKGANTGLNSGSDIHLSPIPGATDGDFAVVIGVANANLTSTQLGGVRGTLGGPVFIRAAHVPFSSGTHTYGVWYAKVGRNFFGGFPDIIWEWSSGTNVRLAMWFIVNDSREIVRSVTGFENTVASDTQSIPAGTAEFLMNGTLAIPTFAATANNLTAFDAPINSVELTDQSVVVLLTNRMALETSSAIGMPVGGSPSWTANSVGANAAARSVIVDIPPVSGLFADAFLKGTVIFADAFLTVAPSTVFPIIWEDDFDDRCVVGDWGPPVWQALPGQGTGLTVDGAVGVSNATGQVLTGYPAAAENSSYDFDVLFATRSAANAVTLQSTGATGLSFTAELDGTGALTLNAATGTFVATPNQWYSVRIEFYFDHVDMYVWLRGTSQPSSPTIASGTIASSFFTPRMTVDGTTETQVDNFVVRSVAPGWKRFYTFTANADIKATQTTHCIPNAFSPSGQTCGVPNVIFLEAELNRGGRIVIDAYVRNTSPTRTLPADAMLVAYYLFHADAVLIVDTRVRHDRGGPEHTGVDHGIDHLLAATIEGYLAGTNLHDLLVDIDARLSELEAQ